MYSYLSIFQKRIIFVFIFVCFQKQIIFIFVFVKILKNEYYSNNKVLKRTSKNNIIHHIWGFFLQILEDFHITFTIFYNFFVLSLVYLKAFWDIFVYYSNNICICIRICCDFENEYYSYSYSFDFEKRILFVFVFVWFWKTNIIRIRIRLILKIEYYSYSYSV